MTFAARRRSADRIRSRCASARNCSHASSSRCWQHGRDVSPPDVTIVGSPTGGADGNVSLVVLPGGVRMYFSGPGVFYPDKRPTQRVGIVPDIVSIPTIAGIQNGVDDVLERALAIARAAR